MKLQRASLREKAERIKTLVDDPEYRPLLGYIPPVRVNSSIKLSRKEARFCEEYVNNGGIASQALKSAGYKTTMSNIVHRPKIMAYIDKLQTHLTSDFRVTAARTLEELAAIAFSDIRNVAKIEGGELKITLNEDTPKYISSTIQSIKQSPDGRIEIKLWDKMNALEKLGKHLLLFDRNSEREKTTPDQIILNTLIQIGGDQLPLLRDSFAAQSPLPDTIGEEADADDPQEAPGNG